jgi:hypothetical protein
MSAMQLPWPLSSAGPLIGVTVSMLVGLVLSLWLLKIAMAVNQ